MSETLKAACFSSTEQATLHLAHTDWHLCYPVTLPPQDSDSAIYTLKFRLCKQRPPGCSEVRTQIWFCNSVAGLSK